MAHFAKVDDENTVTEVHCLHNDVLSFNGVELEQQGIAFLEKLHGGGTWVQTSYNTNGGVHRTGGEPFRKNYAGKGYQWREDLDGFVPPRPYDSWSLEPETCQWKPPVPMPEDADKNKRYVWDEENLGWEVIPVPNPQDFKPLDESGGDK